MNEFYTKRWSCLNIEFDITLPSRLSIYLFRRYVIFKRRESCRALTDPTIFYY